MKHEAHKRLEDSQTISTQAAALNGLWRRSALRSPDGRDRRVHSRFSTDDSAQVSIVNSPEKPEPEGLTMESRVVDVSRGGMRLRIPILLKPGTMIRVLLGDTEVVAEVRYCVAADGAHFAGVQVQNVS